MTYIKREAENIIENLVHTFKVVLITGPRQIGKSTMLEKIFKDDYQYITLDDLALQTIASQDPKLFFLNNPGKLIIDEIQYCPELLPEIKRLVDSNDERGQFILTGSQTFHLMKNVSESLAGRVGIFEMKSLSTSEIVSTPRVEPFIPSLSNIAKPALLDYQNLWKRIHRGSLPELYKFPDLDWQLYYSSYVSTFIQRDVRQLTAIQNLTLFNTFMSVLAARAGQELNYSAIANEVGVDQKTIKSWLGILQASGIVYLIQPFSNNQLKRTLKSPVLYFFDTGLLAYFGRWTTSETLQNGAFSGAILENYCINEITKSFINSGNHSVNFYFYRDKDQREIDLIIDCDGTLYPIEIKKSTNPTLNMTKHFSVLDKVTSHKIGPKTILAIVERSYLLTENTIVYPIAAI